MSAFYPGRVVAMTGYGVNDALALLLAAAN